MPFPIPSHRRAPSRLAIPGALAVVLVASAVVPASRAHAQGVGRPAADSTASAARPDPPRRAERQHALSVQPLHAVFGSFSGEYERFAGSLLSLAGAVTYSDAELFDWNDYYQQSSTSADVKLRLYPDGPSFHGLSLGIQGGGRRERQTAVTGDPPRFADYSEWRWNPTIGFLIERGWLDRRNGRTLVAGGIGAKRVLRSAPFEDYSYMTLRLSVGVAF